MITNLTNIQWIIIIVQILQIYRRNGCNKNYRKESLRISERTIV
jgi:hypothetical protein